MFISEYQYELPQELIAQEPLPDRASSRMMVVSRETNTFFDSHFPAFPSLLHSGDVLVVNNTRVFPARLEGRTETGAVIEVFLLNDLGDNIWEALIRPGKRVKEGRAIYFDPRLSAVVEAKMDGGRVRLKLTADGDTFNVLETVGKTPLPPYIKRENTENDRARYQTVYARNQGAVAAPTAGLHFTDEILDQVRERNVEIVEITLHVGYGTFEPVRVDDLSLHTVRPERVTIDDTAAVILNTAKSAGRRIIAVGTTVTRALEWNFSRKGRFTATEASEEADLTIRPGYEFKAIDALLTNFHLPKSSLLVLVSTFGGHELIMRAYEHAVAERYRFYSYGDCMFVG